MNQQFDSNSNGAIELSDAELGSIQGGNIFGDAWNAVTHAASSVVHTVTNAVTHPVQALGTIAHLIGEIVKHLPTKTDSPPGRG
jgi:hypothetical protein